MKTLKVGRWIVAVLLALIFISAVIPKLIGGAAMGARFEAWGYPAALSVVTGIVELVGGVLVLIRRLARLGALALSVVMLGAIVTHLRTGIGSPGFALASLVLAVGLFWLARPSRRQH